jgi:hypothetical protein
MDTMHDSLEELVEGKEGEAGGWEVEYSVRSSFLFLLYQLRLRSYYMGRNK